MARRRRNGEGGRAAPEAVLLRRNCLSGEIYVLAIRDMNDVPLKKWHDLLTRAEAAPLPQPNAREFPTGRKRKMTGY
jgi:hypothetical protein